MSFFSSPSVKSAEPPPTEDPDQVAARKAAQAQVDASKADAAERDRQRYAGRTMGTSGANALYTDSAAGFGRPMGSANI